MIARRRLVPVLAVGLAVLTMFCSSDKKTNVKDDNGDYHTPSSPDELLEFLAYSYEARDISAYDDALCPAYLFSFMPEVAESLGLPEDLPWWGKTKDVISTQNLFEDTCAVDIRMDYTYTFDWYACEEVGLTDSGRDTTYSGLCCRVEPDIRVTVGKPAHEPRVLWVNDSYLDIMVVPDPYTQDCWCILRIQETPKMGLASAEALKGAAVEGISWGAIKALWK